MKKAWTIEKERIKAWADFFTTRQPYDEILNITVDLKEKSGEIKVGKRNVEYDAIWVEHYAWNHQLFTDAKEALEDKNWLIFASYDKDDDKIILVKHRLLENFYFKATLIDLIENGFGYELEVYPVELKNARAHKIFKYDAAESGSAHFKEKKKNVEEFFYNWTLKNSANRLRILSGVLKIQRDEG